MIGYFKLGTLFLLLAISREALAVEAEELPAEIIQVRASILSSKAKLAHLKYQEKLAYPEDKGSWAKQVQWENTKITDGENTLAALRTRLAREAANWTKSLGASPYPAMSPSITYLQAHFPKAERISSMHWEAIREEFGEETQEEFLKASYQANIFSSNPVADKNIMEHTTIVFVHDPFVKFSTLMNNARWHVIKKEMQMSSIASEEKALQMSGYKTISFEASAFSSLDDLASEFSQFVQNNSDNPSMRLLLVSTGEGSAIVHRYLDLHSGSRRNPQIAAWVNYNGRLHGIAIPLPNDREIASVAKKTPLEKQEEEFACNLLQLQEERGMSNPSLGAGFKIYNFVSWEKNERPTPEIQDAFESNATSYLITSPRKSGDLEKVIFSALR